MRADFLLFRSAGSAWDSFGDSRSSGGGPSARNLSGLAKCDRLLRVYDVGNGSRAADGPPEGDRGRLWPRGRRQQIPIRRSVKRLGLFGGTFDPVHVGHAAMVRRALAWGLDGVVAVPCRQSPHKPVREGGIAPADGGHRWEMLRLAFGGVAGVSLSRCELDRAGPSYTRDTLSQLRRERPGAEWVLLLGADQLPALHRWVGFADWAQGIAFLVFGRPGHGIEVGGPEFLGLRVDIIEDFVMPVSATEIRDRLRRGESVEGLLAPEVEAYIRRHGLYGAPGG